MPDDDFDIFQTVADGTLLVKNADWIEEDGREALRQIGKVLAHRPKKMVQELIVYRRYVPVLLKIILAIGDVNKGLRQQQKRYLSAEAEKSHMRWTPEEDEQLIEMVCREDTSIHEISVIFGRTPSAIKSRVTHLVGLKRISQAVAGRFVGTVDGVQTDSTIQGVVYKED